MFKQA